MFLIRRKIHFLPLFLPIEFHLGENANYFSIVIVIIMLRLIQLSILTSCKHKSVMKKERNSLFFSSSYPLFICLSIGMSGNRTTDRTIKVVSRTWPPQPDKQESDKAFIHSNTEALVTI